ncbi:hypothetical protein [Haloarchaeobius sp. HME9146]|uniref:hypothetical protein n=1 Tax=Haloarchaeobius sp. HME9146 TaxID=2978732 RepID=UPI0021C133FD|nr:hypothetical protein [Haloarchaeobius sp. HME9146]MCT9094984.1 hypothetical protein [Haloarchaeobius sp. HME9146]
MAEMPRRRAIALPIVVALSGCASLTADTDRTANGVVDRKLVVGDERPATDDDQPPTTELLVVNNDGSVETTNESYRERATEGDVVSVSESLAAEFEDAYSSIQYLVTVKLESTDHVNGIGPGDGVTYRTDRPAFNDATVAAPISYKTSESGDRIVQVVGG